MRAKVTEAFPGRPDNEIMTRPIEVGETIEGDLARVAVEQKWAKKIKESEASEDNGGNDVDGPKIGKEAAEILEEAGIDPATVEGTGVGGMITKPDAEKAVEAAKADDS